MFKQKLIPVFSSFFAFFKLERLLPRLSSHNRLVLMYHGVTKNNFINLNSRHVPLTEFTEQLRYLKKNYNIVSLKELYEQIESNNKYTKPTVAITFDDGYLNNYTNAFPILEHLKIPATFFISSISLQDPSYILWPDLLDILIKFSTIKKIKFDRKDFFRIGSIYHFNEINLFDYIYQSQSVEFKSIISHLNEVLVPIITESEVPEEFYKLMCSNHIKEIAQSELFEIGSHLQTHRSIFSMTSAEFKEALVNSKKNIEKVINKPIYSIAVPFGDYCKNSTEVTSSVGYMNMLLVDKRYNTDKKRALPRMNVNNRLNFREFSFMLNFQFLRKGI